jgi:hypothetical protein
MASVRAIDDRSGGDSYLRRYLAAAVIVAGRLIGAEHRDFPQLRADIRIEGIDAVVFRHRI